MSEREQFEARAAEKLRLPVEVIQSARNGESYLHAFDSMNVMQPLNGWWDWWQASREALKAEKGEDSELLARAKKLEQDVGGILHRIKPGAVDGWISCADRMPEVEDKYITFSSYGVGASWFTPSWSNKFQDCASNNDEGMEDDEGRVFRVTHWQPLPSPPATNHPIDTTPNQYDALGKGGQQ